MKTQTLKIAAQLARLIGAAALGIVFLVPTDLAASQLAPATIRIGHNCGCNVDGSNCSTCANACTTVETMSIETYAKHVLPAEWISSWHAESLKAGAVAVRSFGAYYVHNPRTATYDICDVFCCQHYSTSTYTSTNNAVDATKGMYLVTASNTIARAEYSAQANNSGCGDGKSTTGWCKDESLCAGMTNNGHGRGLCQWGSKYRADAGQSYTTILNAYYSGTPANYTIKDLLTEVYDNSSTAFAASTNWIVGTSATDKYGADYKYRSTAALSDSAVWTFTVGSKSAGDYDVYAWWTQGANRSKTAPYVLPDNTSVPTNQQINGGKWNLLGAKTLASGSKTVKLSVWTTTGFVVVADAVKLYGPK